jgi:nucleoside-diphosphate-sugar epimerase
MKILVLGGSGFLGKKLIDNLSQQPIELFAAVRNISSTSNQNCTYVLVDDLGKGSSLGPLVFDVIINVAMKRSSRHLPISDESMRELNYEIPLRIIRSYSNLGTLVINTSTYIQNYKGIKGQTVETYGATKELLSTALKSDADTGLYRVLDLYLFTLYGPGDRDTHLVPLLLSAIKNRTAVSLSEGNQLMNLLYAQDAIDSIVGAITNSKKGYSAYHLWEPVYFTVRDLVLTIEETLETNLKVKWGAVPYSGHEMFEPWAIPFPIYPLFNPKIVLTNGLKLCSDFKL